GDERLPVRAGDARARAAGRAGPARPAAARDLRRSGHDRRRPAGPRRARGGRPRTGVSRAVDRPPGKSRFAGAGTELPGTGLAPHADTESRAPSPGVSRSGLKGPDPGLSAGGAMANRLA